MVLKCENYKKKRENFDYKCKKIKISKNIPVKIRLPWKRQID